MKENTERRKKLSEIMETVGLVSVVLNKRVRAKPEFRKLTTSSMMVLGQLMEDGPRTLKEVSTETGLANSTVSNIIDRLVEEGFVKRQQGEEDRRQVKLFATSKAIEEREKIVEEYEECLGELLKGGSEEEIDSILLGLRKFFELADKNDPENLL